MISRKAIRWMNAAALLLLAVYIAISALHLFQQEARGIEYVCIGSAVLLSVVAAFARIRLRSEQNRQAKATRDSLLKHIWELRHRREW